MRRLTSLTLVLAAAVPLAACGGDDDGGGASSAADIKAAFVAQGAPEDEAECVANEIDGQLSMADVEAFTSAENPADIDEDVLETIGLAVGTCID